MTRISTHHHVGIDCWSVVGSHFVISGSTFECSDNGGIGVKRDWIKAASWEVRTDWAQNTKTLSLCRGLYKHLLSGYNLYK